MTDYTKIIRALNPHAHDDIVAMFNNADAVFAKWGINSKRRIACIIAHAYVECDHFTDLYENLNYSAERLCEVWPNRFNMTTAAACAHNPRAIANKVYCGRMGNMPNSDDGWEFRGKGLWDVTGRANTELLADKLNITPVEAAARLTDKDHALECACAMFQILKVGPAADSGDVRRQTKIINGGLNGLDERTRATKIVLRMLGGQAEVSATAPDVTVDDLRKNGSRTIAGADRAKTSVGGVIAAGGTVAGTFSEVKGNLSQVKDAASTVTDTVSSLKDGIHSTSDAVNWALHHWQMFGFGVGLTALGFFLWRIWSASNAVQAARLDDANSGLNFSRLTADNKME